MLYRDHPASRAAIAGIPVFDDLNTDQHRGLQCIALGCPLILVDGQPVPPPYVVGVSKVTGGEVRACEKHAHLLGWRPDSGWQQPALL